jgi:hypothetical protein
MKLRILFIAVTGGILLAVAAYALLVDLTHHRPGPERDQTTWEGEWEVPVVEGDKQLETFVLTKNKHLRIKILDDVHDFYSGDEVTVRWEPGKVFVNDILVFPVPIEHKILPSAVVMERYGKIPTVLAYIADHQGEASEDTVATEAMEAWFERQREVLEKAREHYNTLIKTNPPREAAEAAAEMIRVSGLADSVALKVDGFPAESEIQELYVSWPAYPEAVWLSTQQSELPPPTVTTKRVYVHLKGEVNRLTYGDNKLIVRFEDGHLFLEGDLSRKPEGSKP